MLSFFKGRRYLVVLSAIVTVVFVTSLVLPAFGAPSPLTVAKRALSTAKKANRTANTANRRSRRALTEAAKPGPTGPQGATGATGATGPQGPQGPQGAAGTARAYAAVTTNTSGASVNPNKSTPGTTATRVSAGRYCVTFPNVSSATHPGVATPAKFVTATTTTVEVAQTAAAPCGSTSYEVFTKGNSGNSGFGDYQDFVPFNILVP